MQVIGRGGQAFLAMFTYVIFTEGLTRTMETTSVSHDTFKAITLQHNTISEVWMLVKDFNKTSSRRTKGMVAWIVMAACFVLLTPTWLSAMTGYVADIQPFVENADSMLPLSGYQPVLYTIHDGARLINRQNESRIAVAWKDTTQQLSPGNYYDCDPQNSGKASYDNDTNTLTFESSVSQECKWLWAVSWYVSRYGFLALSTLPNPNFYQPDGTGTATIVNLTSPLNISAHLAMSKSGNWTYPGSPGSGAWNEIPYGAFWTNPNTGMYTFNPGNPMFIEPESGTIYNISELNRNGTCQQAKGGVRYQWGFSFLLLYVFTMSLMVWIIGLWILYIDSTLHSRLKTRGMGYERAVLDLSLSMQGSIAREGAETSSNKELQAFVKNTMITFNALPFDSSTPNRWEQFRRNYSFKKWVKDEKWWLGGLLVFTSLFVLSFLMLDSFWFPLGAPIPGFGIFLVLLVGRETHGRWTLFAFCFVLFMGLDAWWIAIEYTFRAL